MFDEKLLWIATFFAVLSVVLKLISLGISLAGAG